MSGSGRPYRNLRYRWHSRRQLPDRLGQEVQVLSNTGDGMASKITVRFLSDGIEVEANRAAVKLLRDPGEGALAPGGQPD